MAKMKDIQEFEICFDISSRMALFGLAMACTENEIDTLFEGTRQALQDVYGKEKVDKLIDQYKAAAYKLKNDIVKV